MTQTPTNSHRTDRRVEIDRDGDGVYHVDVVAGPTFHGAILNIGGRAAAFGADTLEFGGGDTEVVIETYDDSRSRDGTLIAVGFSADAIL